MFVYFRCCFWYSICLCFYYELQEKETNVEEGITRESLCFTRIKKVFVWERIRLMGSLAIPVFTQDVVAGIGRVPSVTIVNGCALVCMG